MVNDGMLTESNPAYDSLIIDAVKLLNAGKSSEGAETSGLAIKLEPERCEGYFTLSIAAYILDDLGRALELSQKGHDLSPECREGCDILAHLHAHADNINDSVYFAKISATGDSNDLLSPLKIEGLDNLASAIDSANETNYLTEAMLCLNEERYSDAVTACEKELRLNKHNPALFRIFAKALLGAGRVGQGLSSLQAAMHMEPDDTMTHLELGSAYYMAGQPELAMALHGAVLENVPDDGDALAEIAHYHAEYSAETWSDLEASASNWAKNQDKPNQVGRIEKDREIRRIGFVFDRACISDELIYIETLLLNMDRNQFTLHVFSSGVPNDPVADRLKGLCYQWVNIRDMTDNVLIETIKNADLDLLIDATVSPKGHRPGVFAAHPANVTANWLAPRSSIFSGLYDHYLPEVDNCPQGLTVNHNLLATIKGQAPVQSRGYVSFAATCELSRISPQVVRTWSRILRSIPDAQLVLGNVNYISNEVRQRTKEMFAAFGAVDRVDFAELNAEKKEDLYVRQLEFIVGSDVYLDTFPMTGRTEVIRALWSGLPVITMENNKTQGQGAGIVRAAAMEEWIAENPVDYVEKSIAAAAAVSENAEWRSETHDRVKTSLMGEPKQWVEQFNDMLIGLVKVKE